MEYRDKSTSKVAIGTTSAQSTAIEVGISNVRIITTVDAHFVIGVNPTATANDAFIPAKAELYVGISSGEKVALRTTTGSGSAFVTSLTK